MRPSSGSGSVLHRTIWFAVGLTLAFGGLYVLVSESFIKHDAVNDFFIPKSDIFLGAGMVSAVGAAILLLVLFFWGLSAVRRLGMRKGGVSYEAVHD